MTGLPDYSLSEHNRPWPTEIRVSAARDTLCITYDDGVVRDYCAELLRVESPSADVQGHHPSHKKSVTGKQHVRISKIEPVGHYAIRIVFDDGHDTGIYTWDYLYTLEQVTGTSQH